MNVIDEIHRIIMGNEDKYSSGIVVSDNVLVNLPNGTKMKLNKGEKLEAPHWLLRDLENKGLVILDEADIGIKDILRVHHDETHKKSSRELSTLPDNFYFRVRRYLSSLYKKNRESPSPSIIDEIKKSEMLLEEIIERRLTTILYIAISGRGEEHIIGRLTPEEDVLYRGIRYVIEKWRELIIGGTK